MILDGICFKYAVGARPVIFLKARLKVAFELLCHPNPTNASCEYPPRLVGGRPSEVEGFAHFNFKCSRCFCWHNQRE